MTPSLKMKFANFGSLTSSFDLSCTRKSLRFTAFSSTVLPDSNSSHTSHSLLFFKTVSLLECYTYLVLNSAPSDRAVWGSAGCGLRQGKFNLSNGSQ